MSPGTEAGNSVQRVMVSPEEGLGRTGVEGGGGGARARKALHVARPPHPAAKLPSFSEVGAG